MPIGMRFFAAAMVAPLGMRETKKHSHCIGLWAELRMRLVSKINEGSLSPS